LGYGSDDFNGGEASGCLEQTQSGAIESNSAWYRFRTGAVGQLGFNIGHAREEDWDFALYRATHCGQLGEPVRCNFFDNREGAGYIGVGEDPSGDGDSLLFEPWLEVAPGEDYLLMINNYSNLNTGFSIQFTGSIWESNPLDALDCSIIDNLLGAPMAACKNETVVLDASLPGALGYQWYRDVGQGFFGIPGVGTPTYQALDSGIYRVVVDTGQGTVVSEVQLAFYDPPSTGPLGDIAYCHSPQRGFDLSVFDLQALGAQDPRSFGVSYHRTVEDAHTGHRPLPKSFIPDPGRQTLYVRTVSLANPDCYDASVDFVLEAVEVPQLEIPLEVALCGKPGTVEIGELLPDPQYSYQWDTGERTPSISVSREGEYTLTVTHGPGGTSCSTSRTVKVTLSESPRISKIEVRDMRANNKILVHLGDSAEYELSLDGGPFVGEREFSGVSPGVHTLAIRDLYGCGEIREEIVVVGIPASFSPNGDVLNETWQIQGLSTLDAPMVTIYDRYGKLIKEMDQKDAGWDGTFKGKPMPSTDYWFKLSYRSGNGGRTDAKYLQSHFSLRR